MTNEQEKFFKEYVEHKASFELYLLSGLLEDREYAKAVNYCFGSEEEGYAAYHSSELREIYKNIVLSKIDEWANCFAHQTEGFGNDEDWNELKGE